MKLRVLPESKTDKPPGNMLVVRGMPLMVTSNTHTEIGLVNGAMGTSESMVISSILERKNSTYISSTDTFEVFSEPPLYALVRFPSLMERVHLPCLVAGVIPIPPETATFQLKANKNDKAVTVIRNQLPLSPAWSITDYKSQGATWTMLWLILLTLLMVGQNLQERIPCSLPERPCYSSRL